MLSLTKRRISETFGAHGGTSAGLWWQMAPGLIFLGHLVAAEVAVGVRLLPGPGLNGLGPPGLHQEPLGVCLAVWSAPRRFAIRRSCAGCASRRATPECGLTSACVVSEGELGSFGEARLAGHVGARDDGQARTGLQSQRHLRAYAAEARLRSTVGTAREWDVRRLPVLRQPIAGRIGAAEFVVARQGSQHLLCSSVSWAGLIESSRDGFVYTGLS